jgi:hypothetical protein
MALTLDFHHSVRNEQLQSAFILDHFSGHRKPRRRFAHSNGNGRFLTLSVDTYC